MRPPSSFLPSRFSARMGARASRGQICCLPHWTSPLNALFLRKTSVNIGQFFPKLKKSPPCSNMVFFLLANVSFFCQSAPFLHSIHLNRTLVFKKTAYN